MLMTPTNRFNISGIDSHFNDTNLVMGLYQNVRPDAILYSDLLSHLTVFSQLHV